MTQKQQHGVNQHVDWLNILQMESDISKFIYDEHIQCKVHLMTAKWLKFKTTFEIDLTQDEYFKLFSNLYKITQLPKVWQFYFKILHGTLVTGKKLFAWGLSLTDKCTFCHKEIEMVEHLIWNCQTVQTFYLDIRDRISTVTRSCTWTKENFICNTIVPECTDIVNCISLMAKYYVYVSKCKNTNPKVGEFMVHVKLNKNIEKYIVVQQHKMAKFYKRWALLDNIVF